jgi:hypothetical protein
MARQQSDDLTTSGGNDAAVKAKPGCRHFQHQRDGDRARADVSILGDFRAGASLYPIEVVD